MTTEPQQQPQQLSLEDQLAIERQVTADYAADNAAIRRQLAYDKLVITSLQQRLAKFESMVKTAVEAGPVAVPPPPPEAPAV